MRQGRRTSIGAGTLNSVAMRLDSAPDLNRGCRNGGLWRYRLIVVASRPGLTLTFHCTPLTGRFGASMSAHRILVLERVPWARLFAD